MNTKKWSIFFMAVDVLWNLVVCVFCLQLLGYEMCSWSSIVAMSAREDTLWCRWVQLRDRRLGLRLQFSLVGRLFARSNASVEQEEGSAGKMSNRSRTILNVNLDAAIANDPLRELFEACKTGDIAKVKKLITPQTVNARDTAGRKSTPLHFAAGKYLKILFFYYSVP